MEVAISIRMRRLAKDHRQVAAAKRPRIFGDQDVIAMNAFVLATAISGPLWT